VALTPSGAVAGTTTLDATVGSVPALTPGTLATGPAGDAYVVVTGQVRRLAPDGTLSAWGPLPAGATLTPTALAVDGAGRVVVHGPGAPPGGTAGDVVARFDGALALDTTFGTGGFAPLPGSGDASRAVAADTDGAVTVARQRRVFPGQEVLIDRLLPSGQPDPAFSGDGRTDATLRLGGEAATLEASTVAGSDVILAGGSRRAPSSPASTASPAGPAVRRSACRP
jgi:hypothetical protein